MKLDFSLLLYSSEEIRITAHAPAKRGARRPRVWLLIASLLFCFHPIPRSVAGEETGWQVSSFRDDRFVTFDLWVESGKAPLAAYQVKVTTRRGTVKLIGVEGGDPPAFRTPPHYDPKALKRDQIVLGSFSLKSSSELPAGLHRLARLHVQIPAGSDPQLDVTVIVAADSEGRSLPITASIKRQLAP